MPESIKIAFMIIFTILYLALQIYLRFILKVKDYSSLGNLFALRKKNKKFFLLWISLLLSCFILIVLTFTNTIDNGFLIAYCLFLNIFDMLLFLYKAKH